MARTHVFDGDYTKPKPIGMPIISFPFSEHRDNKTFEFEIKYRVLGSVYRAEKPMTKVKFTQGDAFLVFEGNVQEAGGGVYEFTRIYASVPLPRHELATIVHSRQEIIEGVLFETQETVPGFIKYEFGLKPFSQIDAPRCVVVNEKFLTWGGFGTFVNGRKYLAEDSEVGIYKGSIFFRKTTSIVWKALKNKN